MPITGGNRRHAAGGRRRHITNAIRIRIISGDAKHVHAAILQRHAETRTRVNRGDTIGQSRRHIALPVGIRAPGNHATILQRQRVPFAGGNRRHATRRKRCRNIRGQRARTPRHQLATHVQRQAERSPRCHCEYIASRTHGHIGLPVRIVSPRPHPPTLHRQIMRVARRNIRGPHHHIGRRQTGLPVGRIPPPGQDIPLPHR